VFFEVEDKQPSVIFVRCVGGLARGPTSIVREAIVVEIGLKAARK
jgi:hypothetical protein